MHDGEPRQRDLIAVVPTPKHPRPGDDSLRFAASGIVWSPIHGDTAFTVPLFHEYPLRKVPANP